MSEFFSDLKPVITNHGPNPAWIIDRHGEKHWLPVGESVEVEGPATGEAAGGKAKLEVLLES